MSSAIDDPEVADLLERANKMLIQVIHNRIVAESSHPESFGVVSGEFRFLKIAGNVQDEHQFVFLLGQHSRLRRILGERHLTAHLVRPLFATSRFLNFVPQLSFRPR